MPSCPACGASVGDDQVAAGVAQCGACGEIFEVVAGADAPAGPRPLPMAPAGVVVETLDEGYEVTLSWRSDFGPARLAYRVLPLALYLGFTVVQTVLDPQLLFPMLVTAPFLLFMAGYPLFNRTTVLIGERGIIVQHGPIPVPGYLQEVVVPRHPGLQLFVEEETQRSRGWTWHTYALSARGAQGDVKVTGRWHDLEALRFVEALAEHHMGIEDAAIVGEHRGEARTSLLL